MMRQKDVGVPALDDIRNPSTRAKAKVEGQGSRDEDTVAEDSSSVHVVRTSVNGASPVTDD